MKIRYEKKVVWGQPHFVIIDEDEAAKNAFFKLSARKCVNSGDIEAFKMLGHECVEVVHAGTKIVEVEV